MSPLNQVSLVYPDIPCYEVCGEIVDLDENQFSGSACIHVGRRVYPRPREDLWHHGA
jgi:hypothetical protein